jgi:hypothetical protein
MIPSPLQEQQPWKGPNKETCNEAPTRRPAMKLGMFKLLNF